MCHQVFHPRLLFREQSEQIMMAVAQSANNQYLKLKRDDLSQSFSYQCTTTEPHLEQAQRRHFCVKCVYIGLTFVAYLHHAPSFSDGHCVIVHSHCDLPHKRHPFVPSVVILGLDCEGYEACLFLQNLCHGVGAGALEVIAFPVKGCVMGIPQSRAGCPWYGNTNTSFAFLLLPARDTITRVRWWSWYKSWNNIILKMIYTVGRDRFNENWWHNLTTQLPINGNEK